MRERVIEKNEERKQKEGEKKKDKTGHKFFWYLREASDLLNRHIKAEEVEGPASDGGQVVHAHGLLLDEAQVAVHPHLALRLRPHLVQARDLLVGGRRGVGLLCQTGSHEEREW